MRQQREKSAKQSGRKSAEARASTTDPEARVLSFSDGGYRPGYNVQYATDTATGIVVGVEVTNAGTDNEQMPPMVDQLKERYERIPDEVLVDGGFASLDAIDATEKRGVVVYAPVKNEEKQTKAGQDPYARKKTDTDATAAWRKRMGEEASKSLYRLRSQTAEWVNALCRNRGFQQMPVRGRTKCQIVATLFAITHNLIQQGNVRAAAAKATAHSKMRRKRKIGGHCVACRRLVIAGPRFPTPAKRIEDSDRALLPRAGLKLLFGSESPNSHGLGA